MSQLSVKLSRCFTKRGKHSFQVSTTTFSKLQRLYKNQLGFFWYPDARFRLIFFRKDFLNSLPHKLTSESFMLDFCCKFFIFIIFLSNQTY